MTSLADRRVFLSASVPSKEDGDEFRPYDAGAVSNAVIAIAHALLGAHGRLVYGGHPSISRLILEVARDIGVRRCVEIYQSAYYEGRLAPDTLALREEGYGDIVMIDQHPSGDPAASLLIMREAMLAGERFAAGVFVGGMGGIFEEYELFGRRQPGVPRLPLWAPGGAARMVFERHSEGGGHPVERRLARALRSPRYPVLADDIVTALAEGPAG
jgi:hypothetical protein